MNLHDGNKSHGEMRGVFRDAGQLAVGILAMARRLHATSAPAPVPAVRRTARRAMRRVLSRTDDVMSSTNVAPRRKFDKPVVGDR